MDSGMFFWLNTISNLLEIESYNLLLKDKTNTELMQELQHQNKDYLEKIIKQNEEILKKIDKLNEK